jgi:hypothetical protein
MEVSRDVVAGSRPLYDAELETLGYDISQRCEHPELELPSMMPLIADFCRKFMQQDSRFDKELHLEAVTDFLERNHLLPTTDAFGRTFSLLIAMGILQPKPQPQATGLNQHGVNLQVEVNPEVEREQRRRDYYQKPIVTDIKTSRSYTQFEIDQMPAEEFRKLVFGDYQPTIGDVLGRTVMNVRVPK